MMAFSVVTKFHIHLHQEVCTKKMLGTGLRFLVKASGPPSLLLLRLIEQWISAGSGSDNYCSMSTNSSHFVSSRTLRYGGCHCLPKFLKVQHNICIQGRGIIMAFPNFDTLGYPEHCSCPENEHEKNVQYLLHSNRFHNVCLVFPDKPRAYRLE